MTTTKQTQTAAQQTAAPKLTKAQRELLWRVYYAMRMRVGRADRPPEPTKEEWMVIQRATLRAAKKADPYGDRRMLVAMSKRGLVVLLEGHMYILTDAGRAALKGGGE